MADSNFIIDIILKARDDTAAAFARASGNVDAFKRDMDSLGESGEASAKRLEKAVDGSRQSLKELRKETQDSGFTRGIERAEREMRKLDREIKKTQGSASQTGDELKVWEELLAEANERAVEFDETVASNRRGLIQNQRKWADIQRAIADATAEVTRSRAAHKLVEDHLKAQVGLFNQQKNLVDNLRSNEAARAKSGITSLEQQIVVVERLARSYAQLEANHRSTDQQRLNAAKELAAQEGKLAELMAETNEQGEAMVTIRERDLAAAVRERELSEGRLEATTRLRNELEKVARATLRMTDAEQIGRARLEFNRIGEALRRVGNEALDVDATMKQVWDTTNAERFNEAQAKATREADKLHAAQQRLTAEYARQVKERARIEIRRDVAGAADPGADRDLARSGVAKEAARSDAKLADLEAKAVALGMQDFTIKFNVDVDEAKAEMEGMAAAARLAARNPTSDSGGGGILGWARSVGTEFNNAGNSISTFDNFIRGLFTLGIAVFFNQIVVLAGAAAGALMALASSAAFAGGALGGALVAGLSQALPMLGIFAASVAKVKGVIDAVKQADLLAQQQSYKGAAASNAAANAADGIRSAQEALADANRRLADSHGRVGEAQQKLTDARKAARRDLEDLILAERRADLAARGATLSQEEAQEALRKALSTGQPGVARARLDVEEANLSVDSTRQNATRARVDNRRAQAGGVEGMPGVVNAKDALADAQEGVRDAERAVTRAARGIEQAKRSAAQSVEQISAAQGKLNYLLANMSDAERELYRAITRLTNRWKTVSSEITEPMIRAFTVATNRITELLGNRRLVAAATELSDAMADTFGRVFDVLTDNAAVEFWISMMDEAKKNLEPIGDILTGIIRAWMGISRAASPALTLILEYLADITTRFSEFANSVKGQRQLTKFFTDGVGHLKSWMNLLGEIAKLFIAIAGGGGAESGQRMIDGMAKGIERFRKSLDPAEIKRFFKITEDTIKALGPIFTALGNEFGKTFNEDGVSAVEGFASFMSGSLIPAIGSFVRFVGRLSIVLGTLAESPVAGFLMKMGIQLALVGGLGMKLFTLIRPVFRVFSSIFGLLTGALIEMGGKFEKIGLAARLAGRLILGPWGLVIAGVAILLSKLGLLDDAWRGIGRIIGRVIAPIRTSLRNLGDTLNEAFGGKGGGGTKALADGLRVVLRILGRVAEFILGGFASAIGNIFSGAIDIITGVVKLIGGFVKLFVDLFSGRSILPALKVLGSGIVDIFQGAFKMIFGIFSLTAFGRLGRLVVAGVRGGLGNLIDVIGGAFKAAWNAVLEFLGIRSPSRKARQIGSAIIDGIRGGLAGLVRIITRPFSAAWDYLKDLPGKVVRGWVNIGTRIKNAIEEAFKSLKGLGGRVIDGIAEGLSKGRDKIRDALRDLIKKVPGGETALKLLDKAANVVRRNAGGPIPGSGNSDTVPALLTPGEHVWTKREVEAAGGHTVMYALRKLFGGGGQSGNNRHFALGGAAQNNAQGSYMARQNTPTAANAEVKAKVNIDADDKEFASRWRKMWQEVVASTRRNTNLVQAQVREMRSGIEGSMIRLSREFHERWKNMNGYAKRAAEDMWKGVRASIIAMQTSVYRGMTYIGEATNAALKTFSADPVKITVPKPGGGDRKATGGLVGNPGERGRDLIPAWIGRGEMVLNHWQQREIQSRMGQRGSLYDIVKRTHGYHAGGPNEPGFAGGYAGVSPSGNKTVQIPSQFWAMGTPEFIAKKVLQQAVALLSRFNMGVTDAFARSGHSGAGHLQHGTAIDVVPGRGGSWDKVDAAVAYARSKGLTVLYNGVANHGRGHHAHIELAPGTNLGGGGGSEGGPTTIPEIKAEGTAGPLLQLVNAALKKVRAGGQKKLDAESATSGDLTPHAPLFDLEGGSVASTLYKVWQRMNMPFKALLSAIETGIVETGLRNLPYGDRDSVGWRQERSHYGSVAERLNVAHGAQRYYREWRQFADPGETAGQIAQQVQRSAFPDRYDQVRGQAMQVIRRLRGGATDGEQEFAMGGIVGGTDGEPMPILAHAGEWVLNKRQQARLAQLAGMARGKLRAALGFTGGPTSFAGGGEVTAPFAAFGPKAGENAAYERRISDLQAARRKAEFNADKERVKNINLLIAAEKKRHTAAVTGLKDAETAFQKLVKGFQHLSPRAQQRASIREGIYTPQGNLQAGNVDQLETERNRLQRAIGNISSRKLSQPIKRLLLNLNRFSGENGLLQQFGEQIERQAARFNADVALGAVGLRRILSKGRMRLKEVPKTTESERLLDEAAQKKKEMADWMDVRRDIAANIQTVDKAIAKLRRSGGRISASERDEYDELIGKRRGFLKDLTDADTKIAEARKARIEAQTQAVEAATKEAIKAGDQAIFEAGLFARMGQILGWSGELLNIGLRKQVQGLTEKFNALKAAAAKAREAGLPDLAQEYENQASEAYTSIVEANNQMIRNRFDDLKKAAEGQQAVIETERQRDTARGDSSREVSRLDREAANLEGQRAPTELLLQEARVAGNQGLADELLAQLANLDTRLIQITAERLNTIAEQASKAYAAKTAIIEKELRIDEIFGDLNGVSEGQRALQAARVDREKELSAAIAEAERAGNVGLTESLTTELQGLQVDIAQGVHDEIVRARDAVNRTADRANLATDLARRVASALGDADGVQRLFAQQITTANEQIAALAGPLQAAKDAGDLGLVEEIEDQINELTTSVTELTAQQLQGSIDAVNNAAARRTTAVDIQGRVASALGDTDTTRALIDDRIDIAKDQAEGLRKQLQTAKDQGNVGAVQALEEQILDLETSVTELVAQRLQANVDAVNKAADRRTAEIDIAGRIASALGDEEGTRALFDQRIIAARNQMRELRRLMEQAQAEGNVGLVETLGDQIRDLDTSIIELTSSRLQATIDSINAEAQRATARQDRAGRFAELRGRLGDRIGAAQDALGIERARGDIMLRQRQQLYGQLAVARQEGNVGAIQSLEDTIADLDASIAENSANVSDNTVAVRNAMIEAINQRAESRGGILTGLTGFINALGTATGQLNQAELVQNAEGQLENSQYRDDATRQQLFEALGIDLRGLSGQDFIDAVQDVYARFDDITAGMTEQQRSQFDALINAVVENATAVVTNTQALDELNGTFNQPQGFSSSAWTQFRQAIFNGMGDVLPQYQIPQMQTGGYVTKQGLFELHQGEFVVNPSQSNLPSTGGDINITLNEAGQGVDLTQLAAHIAFAKKTSS